MINIIASIIAILTFFISGSLFFILNLQIALSCLFGGSLITINLLVLAFVWRLIFFNKSISLAIFIIVIKYLGLGLFLLNISQLDWIHPIGFVLGLSTLVLGILIFLVYKKFFLSK